MKCIYCGNMDSKVVDSRICDDGSIRRRRECTKCKKRYTTFEKIESCPLLVIKNNGNRQIYDSLKIKTGIMKACEKRPVSIAKIDKLVASIDHEIHSLLTPEVTSRKIGDLVMEGLKELDEVSYVRFASVHLEFKDVNTLLREIEKLLQNKKNKSEK